MLKRGQRLYHPQVQIMEESQIVFSSITTTGDFHTGEQVV